MSRRPFHDLAITEYSGGSLLSAIPHSKSTLSFCTCTEVLQEHSSTCNNTLTNDYVPPESPVRMNSIHLRAMTRGLGKISLIDQRDPNRCTDHKKAWQRPANFPPFSPFSPPFPIPLHLSNVPMSMSQHVGQSSFAP